MLKKILGEAPFDVTLDKSVVITPGKNTDVRLFFSNDSEYDLPLSVKFNFDVSTEVDKTQFDVTVPAEGNTRVMLVFSKNPDAMIFTGLGIGEIEISDRVFDTRTIYEFEIISEAAYKCADFCDGFSQTDDVLFTRNGMFFANKGETVFLEVPLNEDENYKIHIVSGKIKDIADEDLIELKKGLNRLSFEMQEDGSFEFLNPENDEKIHSDSVNTKCFI